MIMMFFANVVHLKLMDAPWIAFLWETSQNNNVTSKPNDTMRRLEAD